MQRCILIFFLLGALHLSAQYKNDNVLYKTVDPSELVSALKQNPGYLLLDVRTSGEHNDTSSMGLNIGRFKTAYNIDVRELKNRLNEIADYKDRAVFVYCSHSQRSRRASKMLADSGFTKVFNVNGGMTAFHYMGLKNTVKDIFETKDAYAVVSPQEFCSALKDPKVKIIDIRKDSAFRHITGKASLDAMGNFKNAMNIPFEILESQADKFKKDQRIIFIDEFGNESSQAAALFAEKGFTNVGVLIEGISRWLYSDPQQANCRTEYISSVPYKIVNAFSFGSWKPGYVAIDVRSNEEFNNNHKDSYRNIGALRNAVNIPFSDLSDFSEQLQTYKKMQILIYDFSGGNDAYAAAQMLAANGFKNVNVLAGGLFNLRWTSANVKGQKNLSKLVTGVPEVNQ